MGIVLSINNNFKCNFSNGAKYLAIVLCLLFIIITQECFSDDDQSVFLVKNIKVFSEGESLEDAKKKALQEGSIEAMRKLLGDIIVYDQKERYYSLIDTINPYDYVSTTEVLKERMTSQSYQATIDYYFAPDRTKNLLNTAGIKYSGKPVQRVLLIPILYNNKGEGVIWRNKLWREAWNHVPARIGLTLYSLTEGDLEDLESINPEQIIAAPYNQYQQILAVYNSNTLIAIIATEIDNQLYLSLRFMTPERTYFKYMTIARHKMESDYDFYQRVAFQISEKIDAYWKGDRVFDNARYFSSTVGVQFSSPGQWMHIKKTLEKIDIIMQIKLLKKSAKTAEIEILYTLPPAIFSKELAYQGLVIKEEGGKIFLYMGDTSPTPRE